VRLHASYQYVPQQHASRTCVEVIISIMSGSLTACSKSSPFLMPSARTHTHTHTRTHPHTHTHTRTHTHTHTNKKKYAGRAKEHVRIYQTWSFQDLNAKILTQSLLLILVSYI
jgi:hypothetical protein